MNTQMTHHTTSSNAATGINWRMIARFTLVAVLIPLVLFAAAGRIDWWQGWVYAALTLGVALISRYILYRKNPDLIAERAHFTESEGIKDWDKRLVIWIAVILPLVFMITAGLDRRYGWSPEIALSWQLGALVVFLAGYSLSTWALIVNRFFSSVVRIQTERGHTVVSSGPYRFVRHPGYIGGVVAWLASPILLGSLWSSVPVGIVIALYIIRTAREDRTLQAELPGYADYAQRTRYRLLPGVW